MLSDRINWHHGAVVILGCFILFGVASIVASIRATAGAIDLWLTRIGKCPRVRNHKIWRCNSYRP